MSRILTGTVVGSGHHRLGSVPREQHDPVVRDLLDRATAEAYERGLREGHERGAAAGAARSIERLDELRGAIVAAVEGAARAVRASCDDTVEAAFELATAMAAGILDHEPHDGGTAVAARIRETLGLLEDPTPVVQVSVADRDLVTAALVDLRAVTVTVDPGLAPGEARIRGGWADADLTREAAFSSIRRALHGDG